jgi:hypothetical protein
MARIIADAESSVCPSSPNVRLRVTKPRFRGTNVGPGAPAARYRPR